MNSKICIIEPENFPIDKVRQHFPLQWDFISLSDIEPGEFSQIKVVSCRLGLMLDKEFLSQFLDLKYVLSPTTGLNHIDLEYCFQNGISVISLRGDALFLNGISATAEHAWALFLAAHRNLIDATLDVRRGNWDRNKFGSTQVKGKVCGIIGCGRLGTMIAGYASCFGMKVVGYDPYLDQTAIDSLPSPLNLVESLTDLFYQSDVVFLCANLTADNERLISIKSLGQLINCDILVNTSRGELVDESFVAESIRAGSLLKYVADVLTDEANKPFSCLDSVLLQPSLASNVIITPHIGGFCSDALEACELRVFERLAAKLCI